MPSSPPSCFYPLSSGSYLKKREVLPALDFRISTFLFLLGYSSLKFRFNLFCLGRKGVLKAALAFLLTIQNLCM